MTFSTSQFQLERRVKSIVLSFPSCHPSLPQVTHERDCTHYIYVKWFGDLDCEFFLENIFPVNCFESASGAYGFESPRDYLYISHPLYDISEELDLSDEESVNLCKYYLLRIPVHCLCDYDHDYPQDKADYAKKLQEMKSVNIKYFVFNHSHAFINETWLHFSIKNMSYEAFKKLTIRKLTDVANEELQKNFTGSCYQLDTIPDDASIEMYTLGKMPCLDDECLKCLDGTQAQSQELLEELLSTYQYYVFRVPLVYYNKNKRKNTLSPDDNNKNQTVVTIFEGESALKKQKIV